MHTNASIMLSVNTHINGHNEESLDASEELNIYRNNANDGVLLRDEHKKIHDWHFSKSFAAHMCNYCVTLEGYHHVFYNLICLVRICNGKKFDFR